MATSTARTVAAYLRALPQDRRTTLQTVRGVIRRHLPLGYREMMLYGMIGYVIPLTRFPDTYNGQPLVIAGLANQKQYMALYLMGVYGDARIRKWFNTAWKKSGKKLDMGKSCLRFRSLDDLDLSIIGSVIGKVSVAQYLEHYRHSRRGR